MTGSEKGIRLHKSLVKRTYTKRRRIFVLITCLREDHRWNSLAAIIFAAVLVTVTDYLTWISKEKLNRN